jgi:hypothetical protein
VTGENAMLIVAILTTGTAFTITRVTRLILAHRAQVRRDAAKGGGAG